MKFPDSMTTPPVPASPEKSRIPVMFSATGGWGLPLGVAIHTLCLHASSGRFYDIHIVHDGMDARIIQELNQVAAPFPQVSLSFLQLPEEFRHLFQNGNKDRYSPLAYARLMAGSLFPQYGRIGLSGRGCPAGRRRSRTVFFRFAGSFRSGGRRRPGPLEH